MEGSLDSLLPNVVQIAIDLSLDKSIITIIEDIVHTYQTSDMTNRQSSEMVHLVTHTMDKNLLEGSKSLPTLFNSIIFSLVLHIFVINSLIKLFYWYIFL